MGSTRFVSKWLFIWVLVLCVSAPLSAQETATRQALEVDLDRLKSLDELFEKETSEGRLVGCQALVCIDDKVCYFKSFGDSDREAEKPMTEDAVFRIYSMSKPITSVAVMILVEEDEIDLDEEVATYLPEFAELKVLGKEVEGESTSVPLERPMTIRDLLRHTSGLTYGFFGNTEVDQAYRAAGILSRNKTLEEMVSKLSEIPLLYQPGERFHYSVSTDVLGRIVEVVSEQSFKDFLAERIFEPLKMDDTFFTVPEEKQARLAQMYAPNGDDFKPASRLASWRFVTENSFYSGGGGLCSTTDDYLRFCQMMLHEGELEGTRILKAETVQEMTRNQLPESGRFQFGLGVSIDGKGRYGWGGAAGTRFWIDPANKTIGIFMVQINPYQAGNYEAKMKGIVDQVLGED